MSTQETNTFDTFDAVGNREELHDEISLITPKETPFLSMLKEVTIKSTHPEWQTDALGAPDLNNEEVEGFTYEYDETDPTTRVGTYTQIMSKSGKVSETQEAVDKAGRASEIKREKYKKGVELRTDIEAIYLSNQASRAGSSSTPRRTAGFRAWLSTNDSLGSGGASGGFNSSTGVVDAANNGAQRAMTKALLDDTIQNAYNAGGNPDMLMLSPYAKRIFSTFMSDTNVAQQRYQASASKQSTIVGAADAYLSDFGLVDVVPNRQMARAGAAVARNAFLIDRTKVAKGFLRKIQDDPDVAKTSDAERFMLKCETALIVRNEAAHGVIADIYGMTASS